eukprot:366232-Chlamydomonas_euryale.AAC.6
MGTLAPSIRPVDFLVRHVAPHGLLALLCRSNLPAKLRQRAAALHRRRPWRRARWRANVSAGTGTGDERRRRPLALHLRKMVLTASGPYHCHTSARTTGYKSHFRHCTQGNAGVRTRDGRRRGGMVRLAKQVGSASP